MALARLLDSRPARGSARGGRLKPAERRHDLDVDGSADVFGVRGGACARFSGGLQSCALGAAERQAPAHLGAHEPRGRPVVELRSAELERRLRSNLRDQRGVRALAIRVSDPSNNKVALTRRLTVRR